ncbi:MAG: hypothetical protein LBC17_00955 [Lactobacillaceae bacterium]|nr:hypothetical protein [Lactobacillaceae bacterium]
MQKPYLKTLKESHNLKNKIQNKIDYLNEISKNVKNKNYLKLYEMLDTARYNKVIRHRYADSNAYMSNLTQGIQGEIAQVLMPKLFEYLQKQFPFFNYKETSLGVYDVIFGQWPSARVIGFLDVIKVEFIFDELAMKKLESAFLDETREVNQVQIDELKKINHTLSSRTDSVSSEDFKSNEDQVLILEKENALIKLEKNSILEYFDNYENFIDAIIKLYENYIISLEQETNDNK